MVIVFELTSNISAKLELDSSKKADRALDCTTYISSSKIIEHLII